MKIGADMKMTTEHFQSRIVAGCGNLFSLLTVSLTWGMMLELISPWFIPLTVVFCIIGYGSEVNGRQKQPTINL
jgi:hypothetical protein